MEEVISPSTSSLAVAPGSVKISPVERLTVDEPVRVITGAVESLTTIVLIIEDELPELSVTV